MTEGLLAGIRVVEAASMVLVPSAAAMLADFGAEVIKVEPPEGDYNRRMHELPTLPASATPYCLLTPEGTLGQLAGGAGDHPTALALFGAVMLALFTRERTGRGLKVGTSLLAAGAWANAWNIQAQLCGATFPPKLPRERARSFGA